MKDWATDGWLIPQEKPTECASAFCDVERDISDVQYENVSADWRFGIAYKAALKLCTILMYTQGYRPEKSLAHYMTLMALPLILGCGRDDDAIYLDVSRTTRNIVENISVAPL